MGCATHPFDFIEADDNIRPIAGQEVFDPVGCKVWIDQRDRVPCCRGGEQRREDVRTIVREKEDELLFWGLQMSSKLQDLRAQLAFGLPALGVVIPQKRAIWLARV